MSQRQAIRAVFVVLSVFVIGALALSCGGAPAAGPSAPAATAAPAAKAEAPKPTKLTYTSYLAKTYPANAADVWFMEQVAQRSGGKVTFEQHFDGVLYKAGDSFPSIGRGLADLGTGGPGNHPELNPIIMAANVPYLTSNPDVLTMALQEWIDSQPLFVDEFNRNNVHFLYSLAAPPTAMATKAKITKAEDLKGQRIRAAVGPAEVVAALGATVVPLPVGDVYEGLNKGTIDAVTTLSFDLIVNLKLMEVAPFILDPGFGLTGSFVQVMNLDTWKKLPPDVQKVFTDVAKEVPAQHARLLRVADEDAVKKAVDGKATIYRLSAEEDARWKQIWNEASWTNWKTFAKGKGLPADALIAQLLDLLKKYEPKATYKTAWDIYETSYKK